MKASLIDVLLPLGVHMQLTVNIYHSLFSSWLPLQLYIIELNENGFEGLFFPCMHLPQTSLPAVRQLSAEGHL
jgi:hypothetical protein